MGANRIIMEILQDKTGPIWPVEPSMIGTDHYLWQSGWRRNQGGGQEYESTELEGVKI